MKDEEFRQDAGIYKVLEVCQMGNHLHYSSQKLLVLRHAQSRNKLVYDFYLFPF